MSTVSPRTTHISQRREDISLAKTQPLPPIVPLPRRPFVVARTRQPQTGARSRSVSTVLSGWLGLFALLNLGDILSTYIGLANGMREGNPLMGTLLSHYGFTALVVYKVLVVLAVTGGILLLRSFSFSVARVTIVICNVLVALVVLMNILQFAMS